MRKFLTALLALALLISLAGCGEEERAPDDVNSGEDGGVNELVERADPRKDLLVGEWYISTEESALPDLVLSDDGSVAGTVFEGDISWKFEDGYLILTDSATDETDELPVLYVDEYEMEIADSIHFFKEPASERIAQYGTRIVGSWYDFDSKVCFVFNEDGTFVNTMWNGPSRHIEIEGTWKVNGDQLVMDYSDGYSEEKKLASVTEYMLYFDDDCVYYSDPQQLRNKFEDVKPIIYAGTYTLYDGGVSVEFSNLKGRTCDVTYKINGSDGNEITVSGKGEFWYIGYFEMSDIGGFVMDFTPDGAKTIENIGCFFAGDFYCQVKSVSDGYAEGSYLPVSISIPDGIKAIGAYSFAKSSSLESVTIPDSVISIDEDTFRNCPSLTIHAPAGSYAEQYAKENDIPFEADKITGGFKNGRILHFTCRGA